MLHWQQGRERAAIPARAGCHSRASPVASNSETASSASNTTSSQSFVFMLCRSVCCPGAGDNIHILATTHRNK